MQITQDLLFEFARMGIVYIHLIACCVAIGLVLTSDITMVKDLLKGDPAARVDSQHMSQLQKTVSIALIGLWLSGIALVSLDASVKGWQYFANPKLQAKVLIVVLLTLNGVVLHQHILPWLQKAGSLLKLSFSQTLKAIFAGSVSGVSWFYAAMLGVGKPLAWKYPLVDLIAAYPLLIVGGFFSMLLLTVWAKYRASGEYDAFQRTIQFAEPEANAWANRIWLPGLRTPTSSYSTTMMTFHGEDGPGFASPMSPG
jgi:hypothetical protein